MVLQYLTGLEDHYRCAHGVFALLMRLECIRMMLQYRTGYEDLYRCVYGVFAWCFNISQGKKIIIVAFRVYQDGASISHSVRRSL